MGDVPDWSDIMPEMVVEIAGRLEIVEDFIALRGVCSSWRAAVHKKDFSANFGPIPLLLLQRANEWEFCNLPETEDRMCLHAGFGWLLIVKIYSSHRVVDLLHLFSRTQIKLPDYKGGISFASLSANPSDDPSNFVLVTSGSGYMCSWRPGEQNWTKRRIGTFKTIVFWKHNFYAVDCDHNVWTMKHLYDFDGMHIVMSFDTLQFSDIMTPYLAESSDGELLVIYKNELYINDDRWFVVVRLDVTRREWKIIDCLKKDAIFISLYAVFCVKASSPGIKNDVIKIKCLPFYIGDRRTFWWINFGKVAFV